MGYTHYLQNVKNIDDQKWDKLKQAIILIYQHSIKNNIVLVNGYGEENTLPIIDDNYISFNGLEDNSHESCYIERKKTGFNFCKTARKDYDLYVVCFYRIMEKLELCDFSSDGNKQETKKGFLLANRIFKKIN